ncbi:MAG: hypothetical protein HY040_18610 [Planctomycetes bacterium]|nr:hypothetical protein [Planctomycetota bacterium]
MPEPVLPVTKQIWPLVIVGRGSSAAYYLCTVDLNLYKHILAIGEDDAWAGKRGHSGKANDPTLKINHPLHLIQHFKDTIPAFSEELVDRLDWAKMNQAVLDECNVQIHQAKVKLVSECRLPEILGIEGHLGPSGFKIDLEGGDAVYAYKVVMCAGTGGHRVPAELKDARKSWPKQVVDLDEFARLPASKLTSRTQVVVIGPNAAIDAVHKALNYQCKIDWMIDLDADKKPGMLATQPRMLEAWDKPANHKLSVHRYSKYQSGGKIGEHVSLSVTLKAPEKGVKMVYGDYIVYGVGPDGEPAKMIDSTIQAKLKPVVDSARSLNNERGSGATILGYEAEGTGLQRGFEVFGALSGSVGREIANSKDRLKILAEQIEKVRTTYKIYTVITTSYRAAIKPFLAKSPEFLARQPRAPLHAQLQTEMKYLLSKNPSDPHLPYALEALANLLLAYHTAAAYAALGDKDPNSLKKFRELLNQVATNLPQGTVADHGQLTSINAALGAYATIRGQLPKYMPKQDYPLPGPRPESHPDRDKWVEGKNTSGDVNFNIDNAQNLAIFVCLTFPNIPPGQANDFVDEVMRERHNSKTGFTDSQVQQFKKRLQQMELDALKQALQKV